MMKELNADSDELQTIKRNLASQRLDEGMENPEKPGIIVFEEAWMCDIILLYIFVVVVSKIMQSRPKRIKERYVGEAISLVCQWR